jgi:hypothetical protein
MTFLAVMLWGLPCRSARPRRFNRRAKKEGSIEFYGPSTLGPEGAQAIVSAFNKKYGLNVKVNFTPSGNMTRDYREGRWASRRQDTAGMGHHGRHRCTSWLAVAAKVAESPLITQHRLSHKQRIEYDKRYCFGRKPICAANL